MAVYTLADIDKMNLLVGSPVSEPLYVFLSSADQYLQLVASEEILTQAKLDNIQKLKGKNIFVRQGDPSVSNKSPGLQSLSQAEIYKKDLLGEKTEKILKNIVI